MAFYRCYEQTKVLLKTEELEVVVSMVGDTPELIVITPVPKNINLNQFLYPMLAKEFPRLEMKLWWRRKHSKQGYCQGRGSRCKRLM